MTDAELLEVLGPRACACPNGVHQERTRPGFVSRATQAEVDAVLARLAPPGARVGREQR
jgi:hypothetical protein